MNSMIKKVGAGALAALTLTGASLSAATPAAAQWRGGYHGGYRGGYGGYHRGYGGAGLAVAGLAGLAVGAAIAGERPYYGGGYYRPYYAPYGGYGYGYGYRCWPHRVYDGWGGYRIIERCN